LAADLRAIGEELGAVRSGTALRCWPDLDRSGSPKSAKIKTIKDRASQYTVPYGKTELAFELPLGMRGTVVASRPAEPLADAERVVAEALTNPVGSPSLREMVGWDDAASLTVCIVFTDVIRSSPDQLLVSGLLRELEAASVRNENVTSCVASACTGRLLSRSWPSWAKCSSTATV